MKNALKAMSKGAALMSVALLTILLAGCLDNDGNEVAPRTPVGYVSIYHASPDAPPLDISVDDRPVSARPFNYSEHSSYINFYTGDRNLKFSPSNASSALIDTVFNVADGKAYSVFVINTLTSGLETLIIEDSLTTPEAGKAMVRFVNLSPDAPAFDVATAGDNSELLFENASFKGETGFRQMNEGVYNFEVKEKGSQTAAVSARGVRIQSGGHYTIITRGFITPPSGNSNVLSIEIL